jgi:dipeptidyl aminopeptidase/acylaminoacyl peptidase
MRDGTWVGGAGLAVALALSATMAAAASPPVLIQYKALALSPDGTRVASNDSLAAADTAIPDSHALVVVRDAASGAIVAHFDPCAACGYAGNDWSPDGRSLAFVASDAKAGTADLYVASAGTARRVATIHGVATTPRWSPDGTRIALLTVVGAHKAIGAVEAGRAQVGEIGEADDEQRIAVVDPAATDATPRFVSPADTWVYEYGWTRDGTGFVATAAKGNGDNNWWVAKLIAVDAASGTLRTIAAPAMQINAPRAGRDGTVLFIGGLMSDFGSVGGDLYSVPLTGGTPINLTAGAASTVTSLSWSGPQPIVTRRAGSSFEIVRVNLTGGGERMVPLWSAPVSGDAGDGQVSVAADGGAIASVIEDFTHPPEIAVARGGHDTITPVAITHGNDGLPPHVAARSLTWTSDGRTVQGWLLSPLAPKPGKAPMIVEVHGGPSSVATPVYLWNSLDRRLVDAGYVVFRPNPRGSYGQGEAFTRANVRDFGGGDLRDIEAGIDAVLGTAPVDGNRLGIYGHSYGGFMTMWTVTHSTRFKAAVAGAGIANWISYYGENGIDKWMIPFFGASAYDDPAVYVADSPLTTIHAAKTPTLIYVGERDVECPPAQSVEFWHALKAVGVPTTLVIYEGAGHRIRKPDQIHDREDRIVAWFDKWLH